MFKSARYYQPVLVLLVVGFALCISLLVIVNNATEPTTPTPFPTFTPTPTLTLEPTPSLVENCPAIGSGYQLQIAGRPSFEEIASPDGTASVYADGQKVRLRHPGGEIVLSESIYPGGVSAFVFWSPDSEYVAYLTGNAELKVIHADGDEARSIAQLDYPRAFVGWSPDGRHFALQEAFLHSLEIWNVDGQRTYTTQGDGDLFVDPHGSQWSPDGQWFIYNWRNNARLPDGKFNPSGFTLAAADGSVKYDIELTGEDEPNEAFRRIYTWSPNNRAFTLHYLQNDGTDYRETVKIFSTDGRLIGETTGMIVQPVYSDMHLWTIDWSPIGWAEDEGAVGYIRPNLNGNFDLLTFDLNSQAWETLYTHLTKPALYSPVGGYAGIYQGEERPYSIHILNLSTGETIPLVANASDAGDPDWSPDGAWAAAVWAMGQGTDRQVFLSWMHPDGTDRHDLDADFRDVRDLRWLKSGELAYIAWRGDEASIEIVDTTTNARRTLVEGFYDIRDFTYHDETNTLSWRWRDSEGQIGKSAYQTDGEPVYTYRYLGDMERGVKEFWSPDGEMVALKIAPLGYRGFLGEDVVLAYTDGRDPVLVRSGLTGLGDPLWSPDSTAVAFSQWRGRPEPASLQVVNTDGINLWESTPFQTWWPIQWVECD